MGEFTSFGEGNPGKKGNLGYVTTIVTHFFSTTTKQNKKKKKSSKNEYAHAHTVEVLFQNKIRYKTILASSYGPGQT